ncbi:hypothetical protein [Micromonospora narathiwatensis]|uniref:Uncharacterized protein n=1 Tax=Micromonospora narathiwatensis TaxID=299146 RepID=A0A1A8Z9W5_9ACTN|nr:hypothetical protein [Micromonospora narathiwatensis]SBT40757.1 hypothetical protein GA0070621_1049 [Micromonospora narathiwatensis]
MPLFIGLPHGVSLPRNLAEPDARQLVSVLARTYQWTGPLFGRAEVEAYLRAQADDAGSLHDPALNTEDWHRIQNTAAWKNLAATARRAVTTADVIGQALRQAGLHCAQCDSPIAGPSTANWGLCPTCLNAADILDLQALPCPASDGASPHRWTSTTCTECAMPAPATRPHLTAVATAA